jgi:Na+-transporting NADH:ubiquinone oxidoreductase subunit C
MADRFILCAGFYAGAILVAGPPIACAVEYLSVAQAQKVLFPDATEFLPVRLSLTSQQWHDIESSTRSTAHRHDYPVFRAMHDGKPVGTMYIDEVIGKAELITYAVGIGVDGKVRQIEILNYRESHGYEVRYPNWRKQFVGKSPGDPVTLGVDVANITGATLSCRHVTDGVRRILAIHAVAKEGADL